MEKPLILKKKEDIPSKATIVEAFNNSLRELFFIENPSLKNDLPKINNIFKEYLKNKNFEEIWVYYPWRNIAVHTLSENLYYKLRTSRNQNIITEEEQQNYRNFKAGIAGLSVGSAILSALVISGGPKVMKIADFDKLEITNLNRIRAKLLDIGKNKTIISARETWEVDPFADLYLWEKGISEKTLEEFILGKPKLDVFIDEMDDLFLKILSRLVCKKNKIPILMATDNGDGVILDIERYDLEPERQIFHGVLGNVDIKEFKNINKEKWLEFANKIIGFEHLTEKMKSSLLEIGKSLHSVPQLGTTANLAGSAITYAIRLIANKENISSGKYIISLEKNIRDQEKI